MINHKKTFIPSVLLMLILTTGMLLGCESATVSTVSQEAMTSEQQEAVSAGVSWLVENNQNDDGGYGIDFETGNPASAPASTLDAIMAIAAAGENSEAPLGYFADNVDGMTEFAMGTGGNAGKVILALAAANQDPRNFASEDWVSVLTDQYAPTGQYNTADAFNQSLAILAMTAVDEPVPEAAVSWLKEQQAGDGSWDDGFGTSQNADATAISIMALAAAGSAADDPALKNGLQFLAESQLATGGWEYGPGFGENANSTALVVQALVAAGEDYYDSDGSWGQEGQSPMSALLSWQSSTGAFQADFGQGPFDDFFSTVQAIPAAAGKPLPLPVGD